MLDAIAVELAITSGSTRNCRSLKCWQDFSARISHIRCGEYVTHKTNKNIKTRLYELKARLNPLGPSLS